MQGHHSAGSWWSDFFDRKCDEPLILRPAFTDPTIYRRDDIITSGLTLTIHQVDDIMASAVHASDRAAVLDGISSRVTFKILPDRTFLLYATDI
jgi:hypothetical protein